MPKWNDLNLIELQRMKINRLKTCQKEHPRGNISLRVLADPQKETQGVIKPRQTNHECGFLLPIENKTDSAVITRHYVKSKPLKAMDNLQNKGLLDRLTATILSHKEVLEQDKATNKHASELSTEPILGDCGGHFNKCAGFPFCIASLLTPTVLYSHLAVCLGLNQSITKGGNHA